MGEFHDMANGLPTQPKDSSANPFRTSKRRNSVGIYVRNNRRTSVTGAPALPTADPEVAGALWVDSGTMKVSEG